MKPIELSKALGALAVSFEGHQIMGTQMTGEQCRDLAAMCRRLTGRAAALEAAEDELLHMEIIARDLDLMDESVPHINRMRRVVARDAIPVPDTNVVLWPLAPRPAPTGGGAA